MRHPLTVRGSSIARQQSADGRCRDVIVVVEASDHDNLVVEMSGPALLLALTAALATALATAPDPKSHNHHRNHRVHQEDLASQLERAPSPQQLEDVSKRSSIPSGTVCPNCLSHHHHHHGHTRGGVGSNPNQDKDLLRLEAIKQQILSKLGLATKPNVTSTVSRDVVLKTIFRAQETSPISEEHPQDTLPPPSSGLPNIESEPDDFYGRTSEIIAFAEPGHTLNGQQLLEFPPPQGVEGPELRVKSAALWVRVDLSPSLSPDLLSRVRDRNLTLWIFRVSPSRLTNTTHLSGKDFDEYTEMAASLPVTLSALGWQKFDLTVTVRSWYNSGLRDRLRLLVDCSGCNKMVDAVLFQESDSERPFLVVHTEPAVTRRIRRRALECTGGVKQCCKQRFFVSFKQLGWEDWIIAPSGYFANYCKGDCGTHRTPDTYLNYYTHVIEEYRKMDRLSGMQPCCAPLKFSSMSLIYFGPDSNIIKRDLPKMVVDECGCP